MNTREILGVFKSSSCKYKGQWGINIGAPQDWGKYRFHS